MSENVESQKNQDGIEPFKSIFKKLMESWIDDDLEYLQFIKKENKTFHRIREKFSSNWEIVELCREAIFDNDKLSKSLVERIKHVESKSKELR